jgi:RNA polymerase sigma-70 factor (ECF subfamily)
MTDETVPTWEEVAQRYGRTIYNFAYRLTGNREDALDLSQEVLLRVRKGLRNYRPGSFEGWLWRITHNAFIDETRRRKRRPTVPLPEDDRSNLGVSPAADEALAASSLSEDVQAALLHLPDDFREAVVLCDIVGLTYDEIAASIGVPVGTVRSRIHRGRSMMREHLS